MATYICVHAHRHKRKPKTDLQIVLDFLRSDEHCPPTASVKTVKTFPLGLRWWLKRDEDMPPVAVSALGFLQCFDIVGWITEMAYST